MAIRPSPKPANVLPPASCTIPTLPQHEESIQTILGRRMRDSAWAFWQQRSEQCRHQRHSADSRCRVGLHCVKINFCIHGTMLAQSNWPLQQWIMCSAIVKAGVMQMAGSSMSQPPEDPGCARACKVLVRDGTWAWAVQGRFDVGRVEQGWLR